MRARGGRGCERDICWVSKLIRWMDGWIYGGRREGEDTMCCIPRINKVAF